MLFGNDAKKQTRLRTKATKERDIVVRCRDHIQRKLDKVLQDCQGMEAQANQMTQQGRELKKAGASEFELQALARQVLALKGQLEPNRAAIKVFQTTWNALIKLEALVNVVMAYEWYKYIIRTIPEKKLPVMIRAERASDLSEMIRLVETVTEKLQNKVYEAMENQQQIDEFERRCKDMEQTMLSMYGNGSDITSIFDDESDAEAVNPTPFVASNDADAGNAARA